MKIDNILSVMDKNAPLVLSKMLCDRGSYDNSGYLVKAADETQKVVFALDLTMEVVERAVKEGAKLIITHHPAIYRAIRTLEKSPVLESAKNGISIYSAHLNLDIAQFGIDNGLASLMGAINPECMDVVDGNLGYGKKYDVKESTFECFVNEHIAALHTDKYMMFGDKNAVIKRAASFCGAGLNEQEIDAASDCDLLISADIPHHVLLKAIESGKCVLQLTHYASEAFAMKAFVENIIKPQLEGVECIFCLDERFL